MAPVIVGAINWGLVGIGNFLDANWNLMNLLLGSFPTVESLVYVLVGLAGLYELYFAYQPYDARSEVGATEQQKRPESGQRFRPQFLDVCVSCRAQLYTDLTGSTVAMLYAGRLV